MQHAEWKGGDPMPDKDGNGPRGNAPGKGRGAAGLEKALRAAAAADKDAVAAVKGAAAERDRAAAAVERLAAAGRPVREYGPLAGHHHVF